MLENIVIYTRQGDFILLQVSGRFFIGVLSRACTPFCVNAFSQK